ncbi:DUF2267 domain-containing protein [Streptomyces sp. NPDC048825]|uniref:DUF2267 domain-containing protein n=1 Tax=Streptomyces sp. NPDC048825 TaxID=3365592 RepID=UPI0037111308
MQHDAFIGQVQARARLDSRGAAERVTRASLETLAERVPASVAEKAAAQLPQEVGEHLRRVAYTPGEPYTGIRMDREEFFNRVAERAGTSYPKAIHEARCVIEVATEATEGALATQIRPALDDDLAEVLFAGSTD